MCTSKDAFLVQIVVQQVTFAAVFQNIKSWKLNSIFMIHSICLYIHFTFLAALAPLSLCLSNGLAGNCREGIQLQTTLSAKLMWKKSRHIIWPAYGESLCANGYRGSMKQHWWWSRRAKLSVDWQDGWDITQVRWQTELKQSLIESKRPGEVQRSQTS